MAHPEIGFTLATGRARRHRLAAAASAIADGRLARLGRIMGRDFPADALAVGAMREGVAPPAMPACRRSTAPTSAQQYLFVNGRPVRDRLLPARCGRLRRSRCRAGAIRWWRCSSTLPPHEVDVNVHPAKAEVRFRDAAWCAA